MPSTSPAAGLRLPGAARGRLDALTESMVGQLRDGLVATAPSTPIVAVALLYTEDDDTPLIEDDYACTTEPLEAAFAEDHESGLALLWSPPEWDIEDFAREAGNDEDEAAVQIGKDLRAAGVPSAKALVLREVAWRLSRTDPDEVPGLPADFVAWTAPADPDETKPGESFIAAFRRTAPPSALRAYRQRGWLRLTDTDAPRPPLPGGPVLPWTATGPRTEVEGDAQRLIDGAGGGIRHVLRDRRKGRWWAAVAVEVPPAREPEHLLPPNDRPVPP